MSEVIKPGRITQELGLHRPAIWKRILELFRLREITPVDICPRQNLGKLYATYPDIAGDGTAIGLGDDGSCQSWRGHRKWYESLLTQ